MEFLNNEDVKKLYIYAKAGAAMIAAKSCQSENSYDKGIFFLKISNTSKLTPENMSLYYFIYYAVSKCFVYDDASYF